MTLRLSLISLAFLLLSACGGQPHYAPVNQQESVARYTVKGHSDEYIVKQGDTLYTIAWLYNKKVSELAYTNNLQEPYRLQVGQVLSLRGFKSSAKNTTVSRPVAPSKSSANSTNKKTGAKPASPKLVKQAPSKSHKNDSSSALKTAWQRPAKGKIVQAFSLSGTIHKGIDFDGKLGEPVFAAKDGRVVYAGTGLIGYGKLIIIKHDEKFLSAYGHNNKILVREGDTVKASQKIAEIGKTGTDRVKLHFEIRKNGKSVDPMQYMPSK